MKLFRAIAVTAALSTAVGLAPTPTATAMGRFPANGTYTAVDVVDGSNLTLRIVGNERNARVLLFDDVATVACPDEFSAVIARGSGAWVDDELDVTLRITCLGEPNPPDFPLTFAYDEGTDTISAGGDTYTRA
ncbi:MAG: hypothetical protein HKN44_02885 [Ilumatobacter sp.]|nr:hypothetical protein [Ilumatobacter sp.]